MFRKSFISVYFLADKILILQLNARQKKVKKYATLDLPKGLITNYKVQDKKVLADILKGAWSKLRLREKSIGIVIPEFSTFSKLLTLPKIKLTDLNEAVNWQAQEYLPSPAEDMVMDWRIVDKNKGYEVLAVAMKKEILLGFVEAAEQAGLFPLAIETPSLCLVRVSARTDPSARLIIYKSANEALLIIASGEKIYGTSVLHSADSEKILSTAAKIITHYKDVAIEKVLVSGDIDDSLKSKLETKLGKEVSWIKLKIEGLSAQGLQDYLVPVCMQLNDLEEPADPYSLNLLPYHLVERYRKAKLALQIWSLTLTITLFVWISFLVTLGAYLYMSQRINNLKSENVKRGQISKQRKAAIAEVKDINDVTKRVINIKEVFVYPQSVFNEISAASPSGVLITDYKMDLDNGTILLEGEAATRLSLVDFKKNLEQSEDITSVDVPISSFEDETNIEFEMKFRYVPAMPAKKK